MQKTKHKLAIMQPYFFPYLGYFSLIAASDRFVVFDAVQYIRHGWVNRNRILKPDFRSDQYVTVPVQKHSRSTVIREVQIAHNLEWKTKLLAQLQHYKKRAPHFADTRDLIEACLSHKTEKLADLNVHCLQLVCKAINLPFNVERLDVKERSFQGIAESIREPGDWALKLSVQRAAKAYVNPIGGQEIFVAADFEREGIKLQFVQNRLSEYNQRNKSFVPGLSIIDSLMFNGRVGTRALVDDYQLIEAA